MKNIKLLFICLFIASSQLLIAQNCINDAGLDADVDNGCITLTIPAGSLADISSIHFGFGHTFIGDIDLTISDGTTTVTLYDGGSEVVSSEDTFNDQQNFADTGTPFTTIGQDLSQEETLQPLTGTLASLDASATITIDVCDSAAGDPVTWSTTDGVVVYGSSGETVQFIPSAAACPSNDDICNATPLTFDIGTAGGSMNSGDNTYATGSDGEPAGTNYNGEPGSTFNDCDGTSQDNPPNPGYSTWHSITPDVTGEHCFAQGIAGFGVDYQMALFSGAPCPANDYSGLSLLATSDDDGAGGVGPSGIAYGSNTIGAPANAGADAAFCVNLTAGQTYYLQMSTVSLFSQTNIPGGGCATAFSAWTNGGAYTLTVTEPDIPTCDASTTMTWD